MAEKKPTHVVIDGCVQEGRKTFLTGSFYTPPTKELAAELVELKVIAAIRTPEAQAALQESGQLSLVPAAGANGSGKGVAGVNEDDPGDDDPEKGGAGDDQGGAGA